MRIYIVEEREPTEKLARYWLFDELEDAQSFITFCIDQLKSKEGFTYEINISDPNDRR
jgi:hypothetical protein